MNLDKLNQWLTLVANVGVLIGIFVVAIQLQQTQTEMRAESSTMRTEMSRDITRESHEYGTRLLSAKIANGEELTATEFDGIRTFYRGILRFYENLHYQMQIGVLDEEIWQSNLNTIMTMCRGENFLFSYVYPDGIEMAAASYRSSFYELMSPPCDE